MNPNFFNVQSPIFRPYWLRLLIVLLCCGWAVFEALGGNAFWAILFGAAGIYLGYQFLVVFDPDAGKSGD